MRILGQALGLFLLAALTASCSSTPYLTVDELSEDSVAKLSYPADTAPLQRMRSKDIAGAIAKYAVSAVKEYSGENAEADARAIRADLAIVWKTLEAAKDNEPFNPSVARLDYITQVLELIKSSTRPTRRYYREKALTTLTMPSPALGIAQAQTAAKAFERIAVISVYRGAMVVDANLRYMAIVADSGQDNSNAEPAKLEREFFAYHCAEKDDDDPHAGNLKSIIIRSGSYQQKKWYEFISVQVAKIVCKGLEEPEEPASFGQVRLAEAVFAIGKKQGPWKLGAKDLESNKSWENAELAATEHLEAACYDLTRLAALDLQVKSGRNERKCLESLKGTP